MLGVVRGCADEHDRSPERQRSTPPRQRSRARPRRRRAMSEQGFIRLQGVAKSWGSSVGVEHIDLEIGRGEFTVLLGPSGCGKSTTLRLIAGIELPNSGTLTIGGRDVTHLPPASSPAIMPCSARPSIAPEPTSACASATWFCRACRSSRPSPIPCRSRPRPASSTCSARRPRSSPRRRPARCAS